MAASRARLLASLAVLAAACGSDAVPAAPGDAPGPVATHPGPAPAEGAAPDAGRGPAALPLPPSGRYLGATPVDGQGVLFRVWAPNAKRVDVVGEAAGPSGRFALAREDGGTFAGTVAGAHAGQTYRFAITTPDDRELLRLDPRARDTRDGAGVVVDPRAYAWKTPPFTKAPREASVVYELHVGSFAVPEGAAGGTFASVETRLDALVDLGVSDIELMPVNVHGGHGWGYGPQAFFAPHAAYGTADDFRHLVDAAHARGLGVLLDVVMNHYDGWAQAPLRCFDGACPDGGAGIYFFDADPYRSTPWGPRPAYAKREVSDLFADDVFAWMTESRVDGFRHDSVSNVRALDGQGSTPGGAELLRRLNEVADSVSPASLLVAEDLKGYGAITQSRASGGFGFDAQWDGFFPYAVTSAVSGPNDAARDLTRVRDAISGTYNGDPFQRLLYVESHDTAGNDGARLPVKIDGAAPTSLAARRRAMLAAGVLLTTPGVPMLFMGQEMLETTKFDPSPAPLDWTKAETFAGVRAFYKDMIRLRRNADGASPAMLGPHVQVTALNDGAQDKVVTWRRWSQAGDDMMVVANFGGRRYTRYDIGLPAGGVWKARIDSDHVRYGADLGAAQPTAVNVLATPRDGLPFTGAIALAPYAIVVLGR